MTHTSREKMQARANLYNYVKALCDPTIVHRDRLLIDETVFSEYAFKCECMKARTYFLNLANHASQVIKIVNKNENDSVHLNSVMSYICEFFNDYYFIKFWLDFRV